MIKEVIVVEGRDDVTAVKRAIDAELITKSCSKKTWSDNIY